MKVHVSNWGELYSEHGGNGSQFYQLFYLKFRKNLIDKNAKILTREFKNTYTNYKTQLFPKSITEVFLNKSFDIRLFRCKYSNSYYVMTPPCENLSQTCLIKHVDRTKH